MPPEFDRIYSEHFAFVFRAVRGLGASASWAEDVAQEVFVIAHRKLATLENPEAVKSWLFGIARRVCKDHRRALGRRPEGATSDQDPALSVAPSARGEQDLEQRRAVRSVMAYADELDDERRALFFLTLVEGEAIADAAAMLAVNVNTAYSRVRVMRGELEARLGGADPRGGSGG